MPPITPTLDSVLSRRGLMTDLSELSLLLPTWQIQKLSELAQQRGVNVGQYLRNIIAQVVRGASEKNDN